MRTESVVTVRWLIFWYRSGARFSPLGGSPSPASAPPLPPFLFLMPHVLWRTVPFRAMCSTSSRLYRVSGGAGTLKYSLGPEMERGIA